MQPNNSPRPAICFIFRQSNYYSTWTNCQSRAISSSQFIGLSFYQTIAFSYLFNHNLDFVSSGNDKTHKSFDLLWSATRYDFPVNKTHILTHHKLCGVISKYLLCSILYLIIVWTENTIPRLGAAAASCRQPGLKWGREETLHFLLNIILPKVGSKCIYLLIITILENKSV